MMMSIVTIGEIRKMKMTTDTVPYIVPYSYRVVGDRVSIHHPGGAKIVYTKCQVSHLLSTGQNGMRELSSHETIMLEKAWELLTNGS